MPKKVRQLKAQLRQAGCAESPGRGSHVNFWHPTIYGTFITISGNDGDDAQRYHQKKADDILRLIEKALLDRRTP